MIASKRCQRQEHVQVRLYTQGFLHAKCYLFYSGGGFERFNPVAAIVGSSNLTRPGLLTNKELNLAHRANLLPEEVNPERRVLVPDGARFFIQINWLGWVFGSHQEVFSFLVCSTLFNILRCRVYKGRGKKNTVHTNDGPLPVVRSVPDEAEEVNLLARFLPGAAHEFRLGLGSCAVFCPAEKSGEAIAAQLAKHGVNATFMKGCELNLSRPGVKVLTLNSSKGLEFPVVALAGFAGSRYALAHTDNQEGEHGEALAMENKYSATWNLTCPRM